MGLGEAAELLEKKYTRSMISTRSSGLKFLLNLTEFGKLIVPNRYKPVFTVVLRRKSSDLMEPLSQHAGTV